jgi:hypothetical protein
MKLPTVKLDPVTWAITFLEDWKRLTDTAERVLVGNIAATVPWLASAIPAWIAYDNMIKVLHFWQPVAFIGGLTIEGLGISTVNTAVKFWQHNRERQIQASSRATKKTKKPSKPAQVRGLAPFKTAVSMAVFYFVVVILLNVVLDASQGWEKVAKALLSLLSPVGAMTIALNAEFSNLLNAAAEKRKDRKEKNSQKVSGKLPGTFQPAEKVIETSQQFDDWRKVPPSERLKMANLSQQELKEQYHLTDKNASNWYKWLRKDKGQAGEVARFRDTQAGLAPVDGGAE